jgi:hypothetical protein
MKTTTIVAAVLLVGGASVPAFADGRGDALETLSRPRVAALDLADDHGGEATPVAPAAKFYMSAALTGGADDAADWVAAGGGVAGGYRLNDTLWVRGRIDTSARVGYGAINQGPTFHAPTQAHVDALVGIETRHCSSAAVCWTAGSDAGVRTPDSRYGAGFEIVPRLGLDVGSEQLRFRPAIEAHAAWLGGFDNETGGALPALGIGLSMGAAYLW